MRKCSICGRDLYDGETYYQQVTAWVASGKRDSVMLRQDVQPPRFACRACVSRWQYGIDANQETLV